MSGAAVLILALVTLQRLGELVLARRNTKRLLAKGGYETGGGHYPLIVALHALWLGGLWLLAHDTPPTLPWLGLYLVVQAGRAYVLWTLGRRWTARIVVVPNERLVARGPFRLYPHPNYAVVVLEIAILPLVFGLWGYALLFSVLNALVLIVRVTAESAALTRGSPEA